MRAVGGAVVLALCLLCGACSRTVTWSRSPDGALTASIAQFDPGAMGEVSARLYIHEGWFGRHEVFLLRGPYTARFVWKQPRVLQVTVMYDRFDDPHAWSEIEKQIAPYRQVRYRDLQMIVGTTRQFGLTPSATSPPGT